MTLWPEPLKMQLPERIGAAGNTIAPIELSVHIAGEGPAVVLSHGFPELAYSWRHQVQPLVDAGFRVIVPNQRGYSTSDSPSSIVEFDLEHLTSDLVGILDRLDIESAVYAGHDWGGQISWAMPVLHPDRTAGSIGVNTPYALFPGTDLLRLAFPDPDKLYLLWFQEPGVAEGVMDGQVRACFDLLMRRTEKPDRDSIMDPGAGTTDAGDVDANPFRRLAETERIGEPLLGKEEFETYVRTFEATGFRGGINWYRNLDRNRELFPTTGVQKLDLPCLMVTAEWDLALPPALAEPMSELCTDLEVHMIKECGHWTQQEKPNELNAIMVDWLKRRYL
jgi:pimeloyl-ACP methyl ester carboxylesterase